MGKAVGGPIALYRVTKTNVKATVTFASGVTRTILRKRPEPTPCVSRIQNYTIARVQMNGLSQSVMRCKVDALRATIGLRGAKSRRGALLNTTIATGLKTLTLTLPKEVGCFVTWTTPSETGLSGKGLSGLVRLSLLCHQGGENNWRRRWLPVPHFAA